MKTNFKNIRTIAAIFLALVISSCHDELIEQQDVSNTNQEFSKKPIKYCGNFVPAGYSGDDETNLLISHKDGNSSSHNFTIQWKPGCNSDGCPEVFSKKDLEVYGVDSKKYYYPKYSVQIVLNKKAGRITGSQVWMRDETYQFATDQFSLDLPFPDADDDVTILIDRTVELYRFDGPGKKKRESVGHIRIGSLKYNLKLSEKDCWD